MPGRAEPPKEKVERVEDLKEEMESSELIGIINMHKMPAAQLQEMKLQLEDKGTVTMAKKAVIKRALEAADNDNIKDLEEYLDKPKVQPALIFSDMNPFGLFKFLDNNKTSAPANPGDIAPKDIVITSGDTGMPPGPAIGTFSSIGLQAQVQEGSIHIMDDETVTPQGEEITQDVANVLNMLDMEPMEVGLDMIAAYEDGIVYGKDMLRIDEDEYRQRLERAASASFNLALNSGYITSKTAPAALGKALREARSLALEAEIYEEGIIEELLAKRVREYRALQGEIELEEDSPTDDVSDEPEERADEGDDETDDTEGETTEDGTSDEEEEEPEDDTEEADQDTESD